MITILSRAAVADEKDYIAITWKGETQHPSLTILSFDTLLQLRRERRDADYTPTHTKSLWHAGNITWPAVSATCVTADVDVDTSLSKQFAGGARCGDATAEGGAGEERGPA